MKRSLPLPTLVLLIEMLITSIVAPQSATCTEIRIDARELTQKASLKLFGNSVMFGGDTMGFDMYVSNQREYDEAKQRWNYYLPWVNELGPTIIRYPHGLGANNFYWKAGIGPFTSRDPDYSDKGIPQTFGTDEFLQYCEEIGARAIFVANVSVAGKRPGTVQDAADWVEYCNAPNDGSNPGGGTDWAALRAANGHSEPYGVPYWELGNEETWPGWESYAQRVREYSEAMKAVDPTIKVGVVRSGKGLDSLYSRGDWIEYHAFMLDNAQEYFDFWIHHTHIPGASGSVSGFTMLKDGASLSASFSVEKEGDYSFEVDFEGRCLRLQCPRFELLVDGEQRGGWSIRNLVETRRSQAFHLEEGEHRLTLVARDLVQGSSVTIRQQIRLHAEGEEDPLWVDLKNSLEFYHAVMGGPSAVEVSLLAAAPHTGGKPVFFTETNSEYGFIRRPMLFWQKAYCLRETLSTAVLYQLLLRQGIPVANYWLLFQDTDGVGTLEGVAYDPEGHQLGRLDPHRRPVFHLLKAYRWNCLDWVVGTEVFDSPTFLVGEQAGITVGYAQFNREVSYIQAVATVSDAKSRLSLFVVNLHPEEDLEAEIRLEGFMPASQCRVLTITGMSPNANNEPEDCPGGDCVTAEERAVALQGSPFTFRFPKHSITVLAFQEPGSDVTPPARPEGFFGSAGDSKTMLVWQANQEEDLAGYFLYRSLSPQGPFQYRVNETPIRETAYADTTAKNQVRYTYAVKAVDQAGNESVFSDKIILTPQEGSGDEVDPPGEEVDRNPPSPPLLTDVIPR